MRVARMRRRRLEASFLLFSLLFCLAVLVLLSGTALAHMNARFYRGKLKVSTEWEGTIRVTGDVIVNEGVVLTIAPGTRVLVSGGPEVDIIVKGKLFARGEKGYPVVFDSADGCAPEDRWGGIIFEEGSAGVLEQAVVRCSEKGISGQMKGVKIIEVAE